MAMVRPELTRSLIQRVRTTQTEVCAGEHVMVDAETNGEPGVEVRVQGQRAMPALVAFHATGERMVRVEARQQRDGRLVGIDRQEVAINVVACPDKPLVELTTRPGETADTVVVRVRRACRGWRAAIASTTGCSTGCATATTSATARWSKAISQRRAIATI